MVCLKQVPNLGNQENSQGSPAEQEPRASLCGTDLGASELFLKVFFPS